jgi:ubiquinone/menaquinone biosynthesis C-methylase UbiE
MKLTRTPDGIVIHSAAEYDRRFTVRSRGREQAFRRELVELARLAPGESVLDVGCGTGTLALAAKRRVGADGVVRAIDPSPEMIARARSKARRAGLDVAFEEAVVQALPFEDDTFDVVLAVLTLHQLPHGDLDRTLREIERVLRRGGRLFVADLDMRGPTHGPHSHGHFDLEPVVDALEVIESGSVTFRLSRFERLRYVLGTVRPRQQGSA